MYGMLDSITRPKRDTSIASAIGNQHSRQYDPVVEMQQRAIKAPLWLVYRASAYSLGDNETLSPASQRCRKPTTSASKKTQRHASCALTGESLGTTVAFELAKRLEPNGDTVAFCAAFDSPSHVIPLTPPPSLIARSRGFSKPETVQSVLDVSRPKQRAALNLDTEQLLAIVNVTDSFGSMAKTYHPQGQVKMIGLFFCTPLHSVERGRAGWVKGQLSEWSDLSRKEVKFHECEGHHADMLNATYIEGFEKRLKKVLKARGI